MTEIRIADEHERHAALDVTRSFIVQAPAGSGKTELLVQRYLKLLKTVEKPEEIVAITFTKKAAAEMRQRVIEQISPELAPRLRIQTIDALCASLTAQMPVLSKFGAQPQVVEDATDLYEEAAARTLAEITPAVASAARAPGQQRRRATSDARRDARAARPVAAQDGRCADARGAGSHARRGARSASSTARRRSARRPRPISPRRCSRRRATGARAPSPRRGACRRSPACARRSRRCCCCRPRSTPTTQWEALRRDPRAAQARGGAAARRSSASAARWTSPRSRTARCARSARRTSPTDLLLSHGRARARTCWWTSSRTRPTRSGSCSSASPPAGRRATGARVFVVGDPMQSIYRFREAQVGLFLHARDAGLPSVTLEPLDALHQLPLAGEDRGLGERRSFPRVLPAVEDEASGAVPYSRFRPVPRRRPRRRADSCTPSPTGRREAHRVVELVKEARGKTAILVRNRSHLDDIVPALKDAGIRFRAVEIEQLGEKQVVQDLYALTRALTHLADRVAWLAILRAPWCGLTLDELSESLRRQDRITIWELMQGKSVPLRAHSRDDPRRPRSPTGCAARCAIASKASGSRSAARPASKTRPISRTPRSSSTSSSAWRRRASSRLLRARREPRRSSTRCPTWTPAWTRSRS